jgi:EmrB/QacA subfamily drug resistance transporter
MGALDTGIVTPARTVIQNSLGVDEKTGVWLITIYTLTYAASIPVMGKLADRFGRKMIYILSISLFGIGSLFCGLAQDVGSFSFLLVARAVQAMGGGGIMPVATAEFGSIFPKEKQGLALGLVGGVYGIANIFGSSAGSAILDLFGTDRWQFIFYVNIPITIFVVVAGLIFLPNTKVENVKKIDFIGIFLLVLMILSLLYGLKNIDFFDFGGTIRATNVYPFLCAFFILTPLFIFVEKKAEDPAMNLQYFRSGPIVITLLVAAISGILLMGMVFVPQFSENAMKIPPGSGGYFVIVLGLFSGVGAPLSGKFTDRFGAKAVLAGGFILSIIGSLFLIFIAIPQPSYFTVFTALMLTGLGIGFTMGAPLNYMMLANTKREESATALATLSLVRSIGTTVAPVIMVAFLAHAGIALQDNITNILPSEVTVSKLPYADELNGEWSKMKNDPDYSEALTDIDFPDLTEMTSVSFDVSDGDVEIPDDVIDLLKTSDVTNITERTKTFAVSMFELTTPSLISDIEDGVGSGIASLKSVRAELNQNIDEMNEAISGMETGISQMKSAVSGMESGLNGVEEGLVQQNQALTAMNALYAQLGSVPVPEEEGDGEYSGILSMLPSEVVSGLPQSVIDQLSGLQTPADLATKSSALASSIQTMEEKQSDLKAQIAALNTNIKETKRKKAKLETAVREMQRGLAEMDTTIEEMQALKDAVPAAFKEGEADYLTAIDQKSDKIEAVYQKTLNIGFRQIYITTAIFSVLGILLLLAYKEQRRTKPPE